MAAVSITVKITRADIIKLVVSKAKRKGLDLNTGSLHALGGHPTQFYDIQVETILDDHDMGAMHETTLADLACEFCPVANLSVTVTPAEVI